MFLGFVCFVCVVFLGYSCFMGFSCFVYSVFLGFRVSWCFDVGGFV